MIIYLERAFQRIVVDLDATKVGPEWPLLVCHLSLRLLVLWQPRQKGSQEDLRSSRSTTLEEIRPALFLETNRLRR